MNIETRLLLLEKLHAPKVRRELTEEMKAQLLEISLALGIDEFDDLHIPPALLKKAEPTAKLLNIPPGLICFLTHQANVFYFNRTGEAIRTYEQQFEALRELVQSKIVKQKMQNHPLIKSLPRIAE